MWATPGGEKGPNVDQQRKETFSEENVTLLCCVVLLNASSYDAMAFQVLGVHVVHQQLLNREHLLIFFKTSPLDWLCHYVS